MKKSITVLIILAVVSLTMGQVRINLPYGYSAANGFPSKNLTNPAWSQDTMILRGILDSNAYKGSCLPYIIGFVSDVNMNLNMPSGNYRIAQVEFNNQTWLKKIPSTVGNLQYLTTLRVMNCTSFSSLVGINKYMTSLSITSCAISSLSGCDLKYLKSFGISNCKNLKSFSYDISGVKGLLLINNGITDLSALTTGDSLKNVQLDSNDLSTIPTSILQAVRKNKGKLGVNFNKLPITGSFAATIGSFALDPNWKATQKPSTTIRQTFLGTKMATTNISGYTYNVLGKRIPVNTNFRGICVSKELGKKLIIR